MLTVEYETAGPLTGSVESKVIRVRIVNPVLNALVEGCTPNYAPPPCPSTNLEESKKAYTLFMAARQVESSRVK